MALKCFGIGLNKTGTKTLGAALRALGYQTASFRGDLLEAYGAGNIDVALSVARDFDGFDDWPWPLIYKELDKAFPGSKFILTERLDAATWFNSLSAHARRTGPTVARKIAYGYADPWENEAHHIAVYERHAREVREHFDVLGDQLLCVSWERGDGWDALCGFLGRARPQIPFPHKNRGPGFVSQNPS